MLQLYICKRTALAPVRKYLRPGLLDSAQSSNCSFRKCRSDSCKFFSFSLSRAMRWRCSSLSSRGVASGDASSKISTVTRPPSLFVSANPSLVLFDGPLLPSPDFFFLDLDLAFSPSLPFGVLLSGFSVIFAPWSRSSLIRKRLQSEFRESIV